MPLVAAAVCPHPPLIVPEVAVGASAELDELRTACDAAIEAMLAERPDRIVIVGSGPEPGPVPAGTSGTLRPYGVPLDVAIPGAPRNGAGLPLSLTIGAWLLARHHISTPTTGLVVAPDATPALGEGRVGLLVMGDGSACRGEKAPGYADPRAEGYDAVVAEALAKADVDALAGLDPEVGEELLAAGRAPWAFLAEAARGGSWRGELYYAQAPYGVGYFVASWTPR